MHAHLIASQTLNPDSPTPMITSDLTPSCSDLKNVSESATQTKSILLVEDHQPARIAVADYLVNKGFRVLTASNGAESIELCRFGMPRVILMDVQMPHMDGLEATRIIRQLSGGAGVKIIAFTALAMQDDQKRCLTAGADAYLSKPFRFSELVELIERIA